MASTAGAGFIPANKEGGRGPSVPGGGARLPPGEGGLTLSLLDVGREATILGDVLGRGAAVESKLVRDAPKGVRDSRRAALTLAGIVAPVPDVRDPARGD